MWWLDPGKEVLNVVRTNTPSETPPNPTQTRSQLFNRILAPYVVNLDMNQVNYGIGQGISRASRSGSEPQFEIHAAYTRPTNATQTPAKEGRFGQVQAPGRCHRGYVYPLRSSSPEIRVYIPFRH